VYCFVNGKKLTIQGDKMTTEEFVAFFNTTVFRDGRHNKAGNTEAALASTLATSIRKMTRKMMRKVAIDRGSWRCARPARLPVGWNFG
jgi:hypothetical protein